MKKDAYYCGSDEKTPSKAQYFSWINSTNEGSCEAQTLANLGFFKYMKERYGMIIDIYAWDAGNLDGAKGTYEGLNSEKLKKQYPNGYVNCVNAAAEIGTRLGVWGGADGYGNTKEEEEARRELLVSFCRDYHFALFKFDQVCGALRLEKREAFAKTMMECRKYSPDLVLLNHRNNLGEYQKYATTSLWQGRETYVDVLYSNGMTAPHHRGFTFTRGLPPHLERLVEDHGVCISSCLDYFEDDLVMQAFSRSLILAPEIYGNPWFLKDNELPILARIYTLHRRYRDILVNGLVLPKRYGKFAVSRGDEKRRFLCLPNGDWREKEVGIKIDAKLGLVQGEKFRVISRFPYEGVIGTFAWESKIPIKVPAFRVALIEVVRDDEAEWALDGCKYITTREDESGKPLEVMMLASDGEVALKNAKSSISVGNFGKFDFEEMSPKYMGSMKMDRIPTNDRKYYETAMFAVNCDCFEKQSVDRSGETKIQEVKNARDAFFNQDTYRLRGCESDAMFDDSYNTFFDGRSLTYISGLRMSGGCLRIDAGKEVYADRIELEVFVAKDTQNGLVAKQEILNNAEYSVALDTYLPIKSVKTEKVCDHIQDVVAEKVHNIVKVEGEIVKVIYEVHDNIRYFILPNPVSRIYKARFVANGETVLLESPKANNLMSAYSHKKTKNAKSLVVDIPKSANNHYISVAIKGFHGREGVYCVAECEGKLYGMNDRAPSFPTNVWEHLTSTSFMNYTYYMDIPEELLGKKVKIYALFNGIRLFRTLIRSVDVYLCEKHSYDSWKLINLEDVKND